MTRSVIPWSHSSLNAYLTCPFQFYNIRILKKYVEDESEHLIWGNAVHKALELRAKNGTEVPENMRRFQPIADQIISSPGDTYAELELAVTVDLKPTGFWDEDCWGRGKGDIIKVNYNKAFVGDYKTGKKKPNMQQLDIMVGLVFAKFPEVEQATGAFLWTQDPTAPTVQKYTRDQLSSLFDGLKKDIDDMKYSEQNNIWPCKPSGLCRPNPRTGFKGCPVLECKHNGRTR